MKISAADRLSVNLARNVALPSSRFLLASSIAAYAVGKTTTLEGVPVSQQGVSQAVSIRIFNTKARQADVGL
jgi:dipeptide/tripeptide permease